MASDKKWLPRTPQYHKIFAVEGGLFMASQGEEKLVGRIIHYYSHLGVGIIDLTHGDLNVGDTIHVHGKHTDFTQTIDSMQLEHQDVTRVEKGKMVGVKVKEKVREHDQVLRVM